MRELTEKTAACISKIYARFLTKEQDRQKTQELMFRGTPETFPGQEKVKEFQKRLYEKLVCKITTSSVTILHVKYLPESLLKEVLKDCSISDADENYSYFFPRDTNVSLSTFRKGEIGIYMRSGHRI